MRFRQLCALEKEAVVRSDESQVAVKIESLLDQGLNLVNGAAHGNEGLFFIACVGRLVDLIVIDVDHLVRPHEFLAAVLAHAAEVFRPDRYATDAAENFAAEFDARGRLAIDQDITVRCVGQRRMRQQRRHPQLGIRG